MRRKRTLPAIAASLAWALLGLGAHGCGQRVDGQLSIELVAGCRPTLAEIQAEVDLFCISLERSDGTSLVDPNCSSSLADVDLKIDEPSEPVVVVVEGLQRLDNGRHQVKARGKSPPVLLFSGEQASIDVPITPVGSFGLVAAGGGGCPPLPVPLEGHTATVYPSGHVILTGSARPEADADTVGLLIDGTRFAAQLLPTPTTLYRHDHFAAALDDGRLVLAGGLATDTGQASRVVVVLRGTDLLLESYKPGVDYSAGLFFEPLERTLTHPRPRPAAAVFNGQQVLIADGDEPAELFLGETETSAELSISEQGGQAFPLNGLTVTPIPISEQVAVLIGTPSRVGRLTVSPTGRNAIYHGYPASLSGRDRPVGVSLPDGTVMAVGHRTGGAVADSPLVVVEPGDTDVSPVVHEIPVPPGFPERGHTATLLLDGRVLVLGGVDADGLPADSFLVVPGDRPADWEVIAGPELNVQRRAHTASRLPDGRVLVVGGAEVGASAIDPALSAEVIAF